MTKVIFSFDGIQTSIQCLKEDKMANAQQEVGEFVSRSEQFIENNKKNTVLKKRVKRLGVHQVLIDGMQPREAANYSKKFLWQKNPQKLAQWQALGKNVPFWKVLDRECASRGF